MLQYKYNKNESLASERLFIIYGLYHMYFCVPSVDMHFTDKITYTMIMKHGSQSLYLILYLIEKPSNTFENRADPDQAALVRTA